MDNPNPNPMDIHLWTTLPNPMDIHLWTTLTLTLWKFTYGQP